MKETLPRKTESRGKEDSTVALGKTGAGNGVKSVEKGGGGRKQLFLGREPTLTLTILDLDR